MTNIKNIILYKFIFDILLLYLALAALLGLMGIVYLPPFTTLDNKTFAAYFFGIILAVFISDVILLSFKHRMKTT